MGGIILDAGKVKSYVLPNLTKTENIMQEVYSISQSLRNTLPSSFAYKNTVDEIINQIYYLRKEINRVELNIDEKIYKVKNIESKTQSKVSNISAAAGAIVSGAVTITGASTGSAIAASNSKSSSVVESEDETNFLDSLVDTGANVVNFFVSALKSIGKFLKNLFEGTKAAIAKAVKFIWEKFAKAINYVKNKAKEITSVVWKALKNTGAAIWNGITTVCKGIWDGAKWLGTKIWDGCKKIGKAICNFVTEDVIPFFMNVGKVIYNINRWIFVGGFASATNFVISILKGIGQFGEALVDGVTMILGGVASIFTGIYDGYQAIKSSITGEEWHSATKAMWTKGIMPFTSKEYVKGWHASFYESKAGKWLDDNAWGWFKSNSIACDIGSAVGYVAGIILLTAATLGVGTAVTGVSAGASASTTISTGLATVAGTGKSGSKNFNALKNEDGTFDNVTGEQISKAVAGSYVSGTIEGAAWYFTYGQGGKVLETGASKITNKKAIGKILGTKTKARMGIQFTKTIFNDGVVNPWAQDKELTTTDRLVVLKDATINAVVSGVYDKYFGGKFIGDRAKGISSKYATRISKNDLDGGFEIGGESFEGPEVITEGIKKTAGKGIKDGYASIIDSIINLFIPSDAQN